MEERYADRMVTKVNDFQRPRSKYAAPPSIATLAKGVTLTTEIYVALLENGKLRRQMMERILSHFVAMSPQELSTSLDDWMDELFNQTNLSEDEIADEIVSRLRQ